MNKHPERTPIKTQFFAISGPSHSERWKRLCMLVVALPLGVGLGCDDGPSRGQEPVVSIPGEHSTASSPTGAPETGPTLAEQRQRAYDDAKRKIDVALDEPGLSGAPGFENERASLVARAKAEPVVFIRAPQATEASPGVTSLRDTFENTDFPWRELKSLRRRFVNRPELARELLLKEGYIYAEDPNRAFTLVSQIKPRHLFDEPRLWLHRGPWLMHAERDEKGDYYFLDGPEKGKKVRLLHLDRVGSSEQVPAPLHRDFRGLRYRLFFERARLKHITEQQIVAELRYGKYWVTTLLKSDGAHLELEAEMIPPQLADDIAAARRLLERKARAVSELRVAMRAQIDEGLPFDEPKTEVGQQDGTLRRIWRYAYSAGQDYYKFNDDRYPVFGADGSPHVPQVCVDFMVDTFERASGNWWRPRGEERGRTGGGLNLKDFVENDQLRRTKGFLQFAREHEEWFEVLTFPKQLRVELGYKTQFFNWLEQQADHFEPGDIVFIRGVTPWDEVEEHSHSFFVYETDPLTGMPIAIAGNAGPANLWSWETEARRTPHRTVRDRVRPKIKWLETFLSPDPNQILEPPALVSGRK